MTAENRSTDKHSAGVFDIRNVIAALLGLYGVVLIICSFALDPGVNPDTGMPKEPVDNLITGVGLVVVAAVFFAWAKLRPILVPDEEAQVQEHA
ncbi:hypothetical protein CATYP_05690 [Corynebacterium atypicum]|uniref:Cell wall anchor protein n=1 Tax=Corynebacterium atypicum TaxID=191610 RepID=A0ABN4DFQ2_9CORY|nr:hypothetical protein [Corynebacterium atypicum]AIG64191.1 hypothetical protein CATYP_05690 [Corynebacterium atypicum]